MSAKRLDGWVWKMAIFADVQYYIYADIVGGIPREDSLEDFVGPQTLFAWDLHS